MKTKLYKKFLKLVYKSLKISKKRLFSRDFSECVLPCYKFNYSTKKLERDNTNIIVLSTAHPLSQIYDAFSFHARWLLKYWKHSHWKSYVYVKTSLGTKEEDAIFEVLQSKAK